MKYKVGDTFKSSRDSRDYSILDVSAPVPEFPYEIKYRDTNTTAYTSEQFINESTPINPSLTLKVGKKYVCRNKPNIKHVEILRDDGGQCLQIVGSIHWTDGASPSCHHYHRDGTTSNGSDWDLVAEYQEPTTSEALYDIIVGGFTQKDDDPEPTCHCPWDIVSREGCQCDWKEWKERKNASKCVK